MFDSQELLRRPSLEAVTADGHRASVSLSVCLPAGRVDEDSSAHGAADVLAALLDMDELRDRTPDVTARWSLVADDFAVSCVLNCRPPYADTAIRDLASRWRRVLAFDPGSDADLWLFHAARAQAAARQEAVAGTRRGIAAALVRAWAERAEPADALLESRSSRTLALTPGAFRRYLTASVAPRALFVAHCGPEPESLVPALERLATSWPGISTTRQLPPGPHLPTPQRAFHVPASGPTAWVTTAWPSVPRHDPRHRVAALFATLLSAGDGPLLTQLRHVNGDLYRIEARTVALITTGRLLIQGEVRARSAETCVRAVHHAVAEAARGRVHPHLVEAARRRLLTRIRHAVGTNRGRAADLASAHLHGLPRGHHHDIEAGILGVTDEALHRFASELAAAGAADIVIGKTPERKPDNAAPTAVHESTGSPRCPTPRMVR